jgi:serine protease AprX
VGGLDDHNSLHPLMHNLYHSTFGTTIDGIQKPDLIAPAIWIPVPILPFTKTHRDAKLLFELLNTTDEAYLKAKHTNVAGELGVNPLSKPANASEIRQALEEAIALRKLISPHYLHGDGTSFAAPIVSSIVAQLLEANPGLSPSGVRTVLTQTARKLPYAPIDRQGYGVVHPLSALCSLDNVEIPIATDFTPLINYRTKTIEFELFREAHHAALTGDFTQWNPEGLPLVESSHKGAWKRCEVLFSPGVYRYKYILNNNEWIADVSNLYRELDGMGGFNSKLFIE